MRQRVISAIIALLLTIPILVNGGLAFKLGVYFLALLSLRELMNVRKTKK